MPTVRRPLLAAALAGFVGTSLITLGALAPRSPFTSTVTGSWPLVAPGVLLSSPWVGVLLVYAGLVVVLGAWCATYTFCRRHPEQPRRRLLGVAGAWALPLLVAPPLFSRDVYAYAALGQLSSRGVDPYRHGPAWLGHASFLRFVDPLWRHAPAPYGPLFLDLGRLDAALAGNSVFAAVAGYRLVALAGVLLVALSVPVIARCVGQPPSLALVLAVLNPLVLLTLVGGAHNDALMLGLMVAGVAAACRRHPVAGIALCALAAEVKVPGALGIVFIGWAWAGPGALPRRRGGYVALSVLLGGAVMAAVSLASGLGWGWLSGLSDPGTVVSWLDPATALGLAASHALHLAGLGPHRDLAVAAGRALALLAAGAVTVVMLVRSDRDGLPRALGVSLLALVLLGPVVWPWYETWGLVFLALVARRWARRTVLVLSTVGCFATVPAHVTLTPHEGLAMGAVLVPLVLAAVWSVRRLGRPAVSALGG
ncbi:MAG: polyprenol phosphomannose-dependent alpha 1,6 mannosyltransferase MptB [Acidimicrobiales bacterium]